MKVKRSISIITIAIFILLCFCSCSKNEKSSSQDTNTKMPDYQYMFSSIDNDFPMQKTDNGYYTILNSQIVYIDAKTLKATPLCGKPDCLHNYNFPDCNANIDNLYAGVHNFQIYKDHLYVMTYDSKKAINSDEYMEEYSLLQISFDGATKEKVFSTQKEISDWFIYDDYIYYQVMVSPDNEKDDTDGKNFYRVKFGSKDNPEIFFDFRNSKDGYACEGDFLNAYKGYIYFSETGFKSQKYYEDAMKGKKIPRNSDIWKLLCINTKTGEKTVIAENNYDKNEVVSFSGIYKGKVLYTVTDKNKHDNIYLCSPNGNDKKKIKTLDSQSFIVFCDNKYIYLDNEYCIKNEDSTLKRSYTVLNENGKEVSKVYLPKELIEEKMCFFKRTGFDNNYFWTKGTDGSSEVLYAIDKKLINKNNTELTYKKVY